MQRLGAAGFALAGLISLTIAWRLWPDGRGFGTHEQLGLAPCAVFAWSGWPCPSCGMTTAWAYAVRGQLAAALHANAGGALLCGAVAVATPWAAATAVRGSWIAFRPSPAWLLWIGSGWLTVTILDWMRKIATG